MERASSWLKFLMLIALLLSTDSFVFPRQLVSSLTTCFDQHRKKIHISEWADCFDGCVIQKNGVMYLEQPEKKRVTAAEAMNKQPSKRIALLIKGGTSGSNIGGCHLAHFIRMVMNYKSIDAKILPYAAYARPKWLLGPCPNEEPCMMYDGSAYYDPFIIARHLSFFHPEPHIDGDDAVLNDLHGQLYSCFRDYVVARADEEIETKQSLLAVLSRLNNLINLNNPKGLPRYLSGGECLGLSDCALAPLLYQVDIAGEHFKQFEVPSSLTALSKYKEFIFSNEVFTNTSVSSRQVIWGWERTKNHTIIKRYNEEQLLKRDIKSKGDFHDVAFQADTDKNDNGDGLYYD